MDDTRDLLRSVTAAPDPAFVAALERRLADEAGASPTDPTAPGVDDELTSVAVVELVTRNRSDERRPRSLRPWLTAAAAVVLFAAGIAVGRVGLHGDENAASSRIVAIDTADEIPTDVGRYVASDGRTVLHYDHGSNLATRVAADGTTTIVRFPAALTPTWIRIVDERWYAATSSGVTIGTSRDDDLMWSEPAAWQERTEVVSIAPRRGAVWLFRWDPVEGGTIERWTADLSRRVAVMSTGRTIVGAMAATADRLFATTDDGSMWILDDRAQVVGRAVGVGLANDMVLVPDGQLWLGDMRNGGFTAVNADGVILAHVDTGSAPGLIAIAGDDIIVTSPGNSSLLAIDTATATVTARANTIDDPRGVAVTGDTVWVSGPRLLQRFRVDLAD